MQKQALKIILPLLLFVASAQANTTESARSLPHADSLYTARQYTQAFELYDKIFSEGHYSPAMLLKMAYINEALGHLGESLYYLNLYTLASHDAQGARKMEEMAEKNRLQGYEENAFDPVAAVLREYFATIAAVLAALALLPAAAVINRYRHREQPSVFLAVLTLLILAALFIHVNYSRDSNRAILTHAGTYLMSGPSSASSVVEIVGEGHQVRVKSHHDVWLRVQWRGGEAYVRDFLVRKVEL